VIETAQTAMWPEDERAKTLARLARSPSVLDRYAAQLARRWADEERAR